MIVSHSILFIQLTPKDSKQCIPILPCGGGSLYHKMMTSYPVLLATILGYKLNEVYISPYDLLSQRVLLKSFPQLPCIHALLRLN